jgi:cellulose 1,4-beta-cellobiosidase
MKVLTRAAGVPALALVCALTFGGVASGTSGWIVVLQTSSAGEGHAQALPSAPASVAASCSSPTTSQTIKVTWGSVTHATTYTVYDSTTSATGGFSSVATGVTTTSWTSETLSTGNYWFKVGASVGTHWSSAKSAASSESTINTANPFCQQP